MLQQAISNHLGFQVVTDLGNYLGTPVRHSGATADRFHYIIDKINKRLTGYAARTLSFTGRLTLAKSVLLSIPTCTMQSCMLPLSICDEIERIVRRFIWGGSSSSTSISLVNWNTVCQPRICGGLGIRHAKDQNVAFLRKIYHALVQSRSNSSPFWRSLASIWQVYLSNVAWPVGDDKTINFWVDNWISELGPLQQWPSPHIPINNGALFHHFVHENGSWNWHILGNQLDHSVLPYIQAICPPQASLGPDRVFWNGNKKREFSVKDAYSHLSIGSLLISPGIWFGNIRFQNDWILYCVSCTRLCCLTDGPWQQLFPALIWQMWKRLNSFIFTGKSLDMSTLIHTSLQWARLYKIAPTQHFLPYSSIVENVQWSPSPDDWICLNSDATVSTITGVGSIGGVFRDHSGSHILSFAKNIGITTVLQAELWGILEGLKIAKLRNFSRILVQSDNVEAIKLLTPPSMHSPFQLVRSIAILCEDDTSIQFMYSHARSTWLLTPSRNLRAPR
ncbi:hypothetical protein F3Y22_tig00110462pilonHSYRG00231 [Hibiscus syriacus]|uniref:RNase H type-1 domain-containing protein n=1 Tax=Hibiscus syriacus TaxID=106335 RepID=A0A6A3ALZ7_HIBSY|nr:hypothetical protein F3Y22_tig00110462pilonHSYRG00231 [Hibiscus syriacus]